MTKTTWRFYWSPEGRPLCDVTATTYTQARAEFKRHFKEYAKYKGEVYTELNPVDCRDIPHHKV